MNVIAVDDEFYAVKNLELSIRESGLVDNVIGFMNPYTAIEFAKQNPINLAFLDIDMPGMNGIELSKKLHEINPNTLIVFVSGYDSYALNAFEVDAIGYLLKPYIEEDLIKQIEKAKKYLHIKEVSIFIRTFGNFDIFVNGKLVVFKCQKAKELLAILVDRRGGYVTSNEIMSILFEDQDLSESNKSYYRNLRVILYKTLQEANIDSILNLFKGGCSLNIESVECDYFKLLEGIDDKTNVFFGEYMNNYSWAEETLALLLSKY